MCLNDLCTKKKGAGEGVVCCFPGVVSVKGKSGYFSNRRSEVELKMGSGQSGSIGERCDNFFQ